MFYAVFVVVLFGVCAFALWKGDSPERIGASALVVAWLATLNIARASTGLLPAIAVDLLLLLALGALALKSGRSWPIWATAFQLLAMVGHGTSMLDLAVGGTFYYAALELASYGVIGSLAVGTFWVWQEREALRPLE